jgi:choline-sulfatase
LRILLIDIDALRAGSLGCYGYHRTTSPSIDAIAAEGTLFSTCYASDTPCLPSRTAMMTGQFGIHTGAVTHVGTAADRFRFGPDRGFRDAWGATSLPAVLRQAGLRTVTISPFAERHSSWEFYAGFDEMHNTGKYGMESAHEVQPAVLDWLQRNAAADDWFLHVNYWDVHTPYRMPESFGEPFANDPLPEWLTDEVIAMHNEHVGPHGAKEVEFFSDEEDPRYPRFPGRIPDRTNLRRMIDGYDGAIRYVDDHVRGLIDALERAGVFDETAIIITADHGENMGELGIYGDHMTADHWTSNVPLIVRWPGVARQGASESPVYGLDIAPTLADLARVDQPSRWDGKSFAHALRGPAGCDREYIVTTHAVHTCQRGVRFGDWMYVRTYHDGFHLFPQEMLFDLKSDPYEQNDLSDARPDLCAQARGYLLDWHDRMMATSTSDVDPLWTVMREGGPPITRGMQQNYTERLRATGRAAGADALERRTNDYYQRSDLQCR